VILPANGIAIVTILLVVSTPGIVSVTVVGARAAVDILSSFYSVRVAPIVGAIQV